MTHTDPVATGYGHTVTVFVVMLVVNLVPLTEDLDRVDSRHRLRIARRVVL